MVKKLYLIISFYLYKNNTNEMLRFLRLKVNKYANHVIFIN